MPLRMSNRDAMAMGIAIGKKRGKNSGSKLPSARAMSVGEETLAQHIAADRMPAPEREYQFHATRKWRMDFAWPTLHLAIEVHGGTRSQGRHVRGDGFARDREKINAAQLLGWIVLEVTTEQVVSGSAIAMLREAMAARLRDAAIMANATG